MYLTELVNRTCPAGMEQDEVLELLYYAFSVMEKGTLPPKLISRIFELKLLQISGLFAPEECHTCGESEGDIYFDGRLGAFFCENHKTSNSIFVYDAVRKAFEHVLTKDGRAVFGFNLSEEALEQLSVILKSYMDVHMDVRLKTRDFFEQ
jgi:DNA repair protein RecO (recombination protein O)